MIAPWNRRKEKRRQQILARLYSDRHRAPRYLRSWYSDMILYAELGANRMNLPDDWGKYPPVPWSPSRDR